MIAALVSLLNLASSFSAACLAKDTTVDEKDQFVSLSTGAAVATQTTSEFFEVTRIHGKDANKNINDGDGKRQLQCLN